MFSLLIMQVNIMETVNRIYLFIPAKCEGQKIAILLNSHNKVCLRLPLYSFD